MSEVRLAAWSGPRNLSTAMLRSWENRPDTVVLDEPLYAAALAATGEDHPLRDEILAAGPIVFDEAVARCLAPLPDGVAVSYQKHMAHHLLPGFDRRWLDDLEHLLLIREPRRVLASYTKVWADVDVAAIGLPQQLELLDRVELVVDAADFLRDPRRHLAAICEAYRITFDEALGDAMTSWPRGRRDSDGVWAPAWYAAVEASTGFGSPPSDEPVELPPELEAVASEAAEYYAELRRRRLRL